MTWTSQTKSPETEGPPDSERRARYRRAGLVYLGLGTAILGVTVFDPQLLAPERRGDLAHLAVGLPIFAFFGAAIAWGDRWVAGYLRGFGLAPSRAAVAGRAGQRGLTVLLTASAFVRTLVFLGNGLGHRPRFGHAGALLGLEAVDPSGRMLVNAALMSLIVVALFHAAWLPARGRRRGGETSGRP